MTPAFLFIMSRHNISDEKWAVIGPMLEKKKTEKSLDILIDTCFSVEHEQT